MLSCSGNLTQKRKRLPLLAGILFAVHLSGINPVPFKLNPNGCVLLHGQIGTSIGFDKLAYSDYHASLNSMLDPFVLNTAPRAHDLLMANCHVLFVPGEGALPFANLHEDVPIPGTTINPEGRSSFISAAQDESGPHGVSYLFSRQDDSVNSNPSASHGRTSWLGFLLELAIALTEHKA